LPKREVAPLVVRDVRLRLLESHDLAHTLMWRNQDENRQWFVHSEPVSWENHLRWFQHYQQRDDDLVFIAEATGDPSCPIGQASLYHIDWTSRSAEFGRLLIGEPAARGRGLGREITRALLELGFNAWGLTRVHLEVLAHNTRAIGIYLHCGFQPVTTRDNLLIMELFREGWAGSADGRDSLLGRASPCNLDAENTV
jgi:diamine N-acetyltransferase